MTEKCDMPSSFTEQYTPKKRWNKTELNESHWSILVKAFTEKFSNPIHNTYESVQNASSGPVLRIIVRLQACKGRER